MMNKQIKKEKKSEFKLFCKTIMAEIYISAYNRTKDIRYIEYAVNKLKEML